MTDPTLTAAIKEAYASAPADVVVLHTLEFLHPAFTVPLRVVRDFVDLSAKLEAGAPVGASTYVTFTSYAFEFKLPTAGEQGLPQVEITIDNVGADLVPYFDAAANSASAVTMIYRPYLSTDLTTPHMVPPIQLELRTLSVDMFRVTATASLGDLGNRRFPAVLYTATNFPGLVA